LTRVLKSGGKEKEFRHGGALLARGIEWDTLKVFGFPLAEVSHLGHRHRRLPHYSRVQQG
jgi:hypothetical protein